MEYIWKDLKREVEKAGLFAPSPRETIKQAAALGLISEPEKWMAVLTARNDSVHDYFGIPEPKYVELAREFLEISAQVLSLKAG